MQWVRGGGGDATLAPFHKLDISAHGDARMHVDSPPPPKHMWCTLGGDQAAQRDVRLQGNSRSAKKRVVRKKEKKEKNASTCAQAAWEKIVRETDMNYGGEQRQEVWWLILLWNNSAVNKKKTLKKARMCELWRGVKEAACTLGDALSRNEKLATDHWVRIWDEEGSGGNEGPSGDDAVTGTDAGHYWQVT